MIVCEQSGVLLSLSKTFFSLLRKTIITKIISERLEERKTHKGTTRRTSLIYTTFYFVSFSFNSFLYVEKRHESLEKIELIHTRSFSLQFGSLVHAVRQKGNASTEFFNGEFANGYLPFLKPFSVRRYSTQIR